MLSETIQRLTSEALHWPQRAHYEYVLRQAELVLQAAKEREDFKGWQRNAGGQVSIIAACAQPARSWEASISCVLESQCV